MADLSTKYLGLSLRSPVVVSSGPYSEDLDSIRRIEEAGAGALVLFSLFEEQVELDELGYNKYYKKHREELPEALRHIPDMDGYNHGAGGYLAHLYQAKRAVRMPIIASLNGYYRSGWTRYAKLLEASGADALELNIYYMPTSTQVGSVEVENMYIDLAHEVCSSVRIPVAVKLNPYFSALAHTADRIGGAGARGLVLFNRFYQPDFDIEEGAIKPSLDLSTPSELRLRLRWVALLFGHVKSDLAITGGVHSGTDVIKALMAGANVAMMTSAVLKQGIDHVATVLADVNAWLDGHGHNASDDIRGKLSQIQTGDAAALERANYLSILLSQRTKTSS